MWKLCAPGWFCFNLKLVFVYFCLFCSAPVQLIWASYWSRVRLSVMKSSEISCLWSEKHNCAILQIITGDVRLVIFDPKYNLAISAGVTRLSMLSWCSLTTVMMVSWIISVFQYVLSKLGKTHHISPKERGWQCSGEGAWHMRHM